jgi:hypothetical protein
MRLGTPWVVPLAGNMSYTDRSLSAWDEYIFIVKNKYIYITIYAKEVWVNVEVNRDAGFQVE